MITEDYISFGLSKLLKEKGFDEKCLMCWDEVTKTMALADDGGTTNSELLATYISAPTIQMAMKWLRETQGLSIYICVVWKDVEVQYGDWESAVVGYDWFVESLLDNTYSKMSVEPFPTYEQAAEAAIKYCLEDLI